MDYSYQNTELWNSIIQLGIIAVTVLFSNFLRRKIKAVRDSMLPTAVLAGFLLLILKSTGVVKLDSDFMEMLVYHSIALGFIAITLRTVSEAAQDKKDLVGPKSGALIVASYLLQAVFGLAISLGLAYTVMPHLFKASGILLPMAYGQGAGQANNVGSIYESMGFTGGRSFGLALAAVGYLCACVVGVIMLNVLAKRGRLKLDLRNETISGSMTVDSFQDDDEIPIAESLDKFSVQVALVLLVYLITFIVTTGITYFLNTYSPAVADTLNSVLWGFNFITGSALAILTKVVLKKLRKSKVMTRQYQNNYLLSRISGVFFDVMAVAGIASINIADLSGLWLPFILMAVIGGVITWYFLAIVCKTLYKDYYYEGLFSMYGMMTGTISSSVLLLREIDPQLKTPAANNLILGSSFAIIFAMPMLALISIAPRSALLTFIVLGLCAIYFVALMFFIYKAKLGGGKEHGVKEQSTKKK